jgi:hypothetical protein
MFAKPQPNNSTFPFDMKRFTETTKWRNPWFRRLSPLLKCLWQFILDECDPAGVVEFDPELASFCIGEKIVLADLNEFGERLAAIGGGKYQIKGFLEFQYTTLSQSCPAHKVVFSALERHCLPFPKNTLLNTLSDTQQDKEQVRQREGIGNGKGEVKKGEPAPTLAESLDYARNAPAMIADECAEAWHDDRTRSDWHFPKAGAMFPVGDWRADLRTYARNWKRNTDAAGQSAGTGGQRAKSPANAESVWSLEKRLAGLREKKNDVMGAASYKHLPPDRKVRVDSLNEQIAKVKDLIASCPDEK